MNLTEKGAQYDHVNEGTITEISGSSIDYEYEWDFGGKGRAGFGIAKVAKKAKVGDRIKVYIHGGSMIGQVDLNGKPVHWVTPEQERVAHEKWKADYEIRQHREFEKGKTQLDTAYDALPAPLQRRIDRFRAESPDFRWKEEGYEMAACAEAGRLYRAALDPETGVILKRNGIKIAKDITVPSYQQKKGEGVTDWEDTPENRLEAIGAVNDPPNNYNYQLLESMFPWIDKGHSGNTWGHAVMFARLLVRDGDAAKL